MIKGNVTAEEVKRGITSRITAGIYPSGSQLPSVRRLAEELGANRNTVNKAYRELEQMGILEPGPGRRAFVVGRMPDSRGLVEQWRRQALDVVWQAMAAGVPRERVLEELSSIVADVYRTADVTIKFLECNMHDSEALGSELAALTGLTVNVGLLDEFRAGAALVAQDFDLIVTTYHHLAEVEQICREFPHMVIGFDTRLPATVLLELARLPACRIGLICGVENTVRKLRHIISSYHPHSPVESAVVEDHAAVRELAKRCEKLVVTYSTMEQVIKITQRQPDVVVEFRVDDQSLALLKQRIQELRLARHRLHQVA